MMEGHVQRDAIRSRWNDNVVRRPALATHELIALQAVRTPGAIALVDGTSQLTFAELDMRSGQLAARLTALGAQPEEVVGVCLERGIDMMIAFLAIWKAGGAYMPLDPAFPGTRLAYLLADSGAGLVITQRSCQEAIPARQMRRLLLDDPRVRSSIEEQQVREPEPANLDSLAYVMYTSGSTGRPKGVMISHRGLQNYLLWAVEGYAQTGSRGAPVFSSIAFDMGVPNLYAPLIMGQPVHLLPAGSDPADLGGLLSAAGPFTFIKLTPGHLDLLAAQLTPEQAAGLAGLLAVGADSFPSTILDRWRALAGPDGPPLLNEYGPTEISVANSTYPINGPQEPGVLPIGRPIPNTTAYVLSEDGTPQPFGVTGELYIGGIGVARGYRNMPGMTAEKFVPDPFSATPGARLYRTGDRARLRTDGIMEFLGRADDQIKLRGYRIEPGEVTNALNAHPDVRDALVVADGDGTTGQLVGYVVPSSGRQVDPVALTHHCEALLPAYMVPSIFMPIDRIPLNANGKVDRHTLPAPVPSPESGTSGTEDCSGPDGHLEERIELIWRELLGAEQPISVNRNFFHLGGTSILAARLVAKVGSEFALTLPLRAVFENPSIRSLAKRVETQLRNEIAELSDSAVVALTTGERER
jgi:amino acid adenylation domain-containing protein